MLVLALTTTERVGHHRSGKKQYRKGQTVFVRKRRGDRARCVPLIMLLGA